MRYLGAALIILAAALIASAYRERLHMRVRATEDVLALVRYIRERIVSGLEPPRVWARGFSGENQTLREMTAEIMRGVSPLDAYSDVRQRLQLSADADACLSELLSALGGIDIARGARLLERAEDTLSDILGKMRREAAERTRLAALVALMLSVGGAIVII